MVEDALDDMITWIYNRIYDAVESLRDFVQMAELHALDVNFQNWAMPIGDGFETLVMASYALLVVIGGVILMTHESLQTRYSLQVIAPRMAVGLLAAGLWTWIVNTTRRTTKDITDALVSEDYGGTHRQCAEYSSDDPDECIIWNEFQYSNFALSVMGDHRFDPIPDPNFGDVISLIVTAIILLILFITWLLRNITFFFLVCFAVIALACHALPAMERFAILWWRLLGACVISSIGHAALIWVYREIDFTDQTLHQYIVGPFALSQIYAFVVAWMMWVLHKRAFQMARGSNVSIPGSSLVKGMLVSKLASRQFGSRRSSRSKPRKPGGFTPDSRQVGNARFSEDNSFPFSERSRSGQGYGFGQWKPAPHNRQGEPHNRSASTGLDHTPGDNGRTPQSDRGPIPNRRKSDRRNQGDQRSRSGGGSSNGPSSSPSPEGFNLNKDQPAPNRAPTNSANTSDATPGPSPHGSADDRSVPERPRSSRSEGSGGNGTDPSNEQPTSGTPSADSPTPYVPPVDFGPSTSPPSELSGERQPGPQPRRPFSQPRSESPLPHDRKSQAPEGDDVHLDSSGADRVIDDLENTSQEPPSATDFEEGR